MKTFRLLISFTTTVGLGSSMNRCASATIRARNSSGVNPAARTSFSSGSVMLPSGRTTTSVDMSLSRQKTTVRTSFGPMTYAGSGVATPPGRVAAAVVGAGAGTAILCGSADAVCATDGVAVTATALSDTNALTSAAAIGDGACMITVSSNLRHGSRASTGAPRANANLAADA